MTNLSDKYKDSLPFESSNITTITSNYIASNNETIFVNSASSSLTVTLPSSPIQGSKIKVLDIAANSQNNNITLLGNGNNIGGASAYIINTPDSSVEVMYINSIKGWNILNEYISITKPGVPTGILATDVGTNRPYNNGAALVQFSPDTNGDAASSYTVVSTPGGITSTGGSSPITVTGLQSGVSYTFKVFATNAAGSSAESNASGSITATTVPQAPIIGTATDVGTSRAYNNGAANVTFTSGATGGSAITSYTVTSNTGGYTGSGASSPVTATGLQSNSSYTFTVTATNANGTSSSSSASNSITATTVPQAPTINSATYGFEHVSVAFTANATGGKAISGYTVTSNPGSVTGTGSSSPIKVSSLTAGTSYTFTATATNANGTSAASTASSSATPFSASGGTITTYGGYRSHTFTGTSNFTVTGNSAVVDYLAVAGGGGGGRSSGYNGSGTGGGGAGGVIVRTSQTFPVTTFTCTIGGGGSGATGGVGGTGGISTIIGTGLTTVSSAGGGGGGRSGGGGATSGASGGGGGGAGTYAGDGDATTFGNNSGGLGGGGAGVASTGVAGGNGHLNEYSSGVSTYYGGGGSGGQYGTATPGGLGGGGTGARGSYGNGRTGGSDGTGNTGGGGGGAVEENGDHNGFNGGSGIIVIRYAV